MEKILTLEREKNVELMTDLKLPAEFEFLMSAPYEKALSRVQLGGFAALH